MRPILLTLFLILTFCANTMAQTWEHIYTNGAFIRTAYSICGYYDKGYIIGINERNANNTGNRIVFKKLDEDGKTIWTKTIGNLPDGVVCADLCLFNNKMYAIGASSKYDLAGASFIAKYNHCMEREFTKEYGLADYDYGHSIDTTYDGNLIASFQYLGLDTGFLAERNTFIKLTPQGDTIWSCNFTPTYSNSPDIDNFILTSDSGFLAVLTGYIANPGQTNPVIVRTIAVKVDKNGTIEWSKAYGVNDYYYTFADDVVQTKDNGYLFLSRWANLWNGFREWIYLIKTDSLGNEEWRRFISDTNDLSEYPKSIYALNDSEYVIIASVSSSTGGWQTIDNTRIKIYKTDTLGNIKDSNTVGNDWQLAISTIMNKGKDILVCGINKSNPNKPQAFALKIRTSDLQLDTMKNQNLTYDYLCPTIITSGFIPYDTAATNIGFAEEEQTSVQFLLYPNPASAVLYITPGEPISNATQLTANVYNAYGQIIETVLLKPHQTQISINVINYTAGAYILTVTQQGNVVYKNRFMVVK
nr:T9SS type A sorting domain-containing protein [Bacteroidota bacterium]